MRSNILCPGEMLSSLGVTPIFYFRFYSLLSLLAIIVTENVIMGNFHFRFILAMYTITIHRETPILLAPSYRHYTMWAVFDAKYAYLRVKTERQDFSPTDKIMRRGILTTLNFS
jgi:hypothetical protein